MIRTVFLYISIFNLLAGIQGIFLSIELVGRKKGNRPANKMLSIFVLSFSVAILGTVLGGTGWYNKLPHLIRIGDPFIFLLGPALFLYIVNLKNGFWHPLYLIHFLPFVLYLIYISPFYFLSPTTKIAMVQNGEIFSGPVMKLINIFRLFLTFGYLLFSLLLLKKHKILIRYAYSEDQQRSLHWLNTLILLLALVWIGALMGYVFSWLNFINPLEANILIAFLMSFIIYAMGYKGLRQSDISSGQIFAIARSNKELSIKQIITGFEDFSIKPENEVKKEKDGELLERLQEVMQSKLPYLKTDLTIEDLSKICGIPVYQLSRLINENLNENFFEFVNKYRVEEVKKKLVNPDFQALTTLAIAFDSGFQSKSTFNSAFKKMTKLTPSAYKKRYTRESFN